MQLPARHHFAGEAAQRFQGLGSVGLAVAQAFHQGSRHGKRELVSAPRDGQSSRRKIVVEEVLLEVHHIGRQFVFEAVVVRAAASKKNDGVAVLGVGSDNLIDPAGNTAADIGEGSLQEQCNVCLPGLGVWGAGRHRALQ